MNVTDKEKSILDKSIKTLPLMDLYERGFVVGLMTAYTTKYEEGKETNVITQ